MAVTLDVDRVQIRLLRPGAAAPARSRDGDAGYDLRAIEAFELAPGERATVGTGVAIALPPGLAGLVVPRSGLAARHARPPPRAAGPAPARPPACRSGRGRRRSRAARTACRPRRTARAVRRRAACARTRGRSARAARPAPRR